MTAEAPQLAANEYVGVVRIRGAHFIVIGTTADFVLDYPSYDPGYDPSEWDHVFRAGLLTVTPEDGFALLAALEPWVHAPDVLDHLVAAHGQERARPIATIDFDGGRFVSTFYDIDMGAYAGSGWQVEFGDPVSDLPSSLGRAFDQ